VSACTATPAHWAEAKLGDVVQVLDSQRVPVNARDRAERQGEVPYYGATGQVGWIDDFLFDEELVLLGEDGAPFLDGAKPVAYMIRGKSWVNNHAHVLRMLATCPNPFLMHQLNQVDYSQFVSGTTRLKLSQGPMRGIPLLIPPLLEQHRIVEAIESYLTRLDAAVALLERVRRNLKHYRASVLKAAVEGRLVPTEAELAKKEGRTYEPASELLKRILVERRKKWIENAAEKARSKVEKKARETGKAWTHADDIETLEKERAKATKKYKEPGAPDLSALGAQAGTTNLFNLPEGWSWVTVDAITVSGPQNGIYVHKSLYGEGTPILRIDDYQVDWSRSADELQRVTLSDQDRWLYMLQVQDLLINRVNSPSHLGKSMVVESQHTPAVFESNMMRLGLAESMDPFFVQAYLSSASGKNRLTENAKWAVNQASINQGDVGRTAIPLPPAPEQKRIITKLNHAFSITEAVRETISSSFARSEKLRQSILKWAFEGKLVPQDPNDEPASILLERIKAERESMRPRKRRRTIRKEKNGSLKHDEQLNLLGGSHK